MSSVALIFPNQLYKDHPVVRETVDKVLLVEDSLFFGDSRHPARFHKQKLAYHRATMAHFSQYLANAGVNDIQHVPYQAENVLPALCRKLNEAGASQLFTITTNDYLLDQRLRQATTDVSLELIEWPNPGFLNTSEHNTQWRAGRKCWLMSDFYQSQRKRLNILMEDERPLGGQWSFDEQNRKKIPRKNIKDIPTLASITPDDLVLSAIESVNDEFADNPGSLQSWFYPYTHGQAQVWLDNFFEQRFTDFGPYEDAIVAGHAWLYHGVLTPMLNVGLLTPRQVIDQATSFAQEHDVPLNSVEGFVRQIIGWREFMRATYDDLGVSMRTGNHWNHHRSLPASFYDGTTGIDPIDDTISRILECGYCHHIERLMVLGGFMFLCEIDPDDIYRWFMEMFVDSYDWVMVPNVYAMSQHADGGSITTKPYFSGSNYVLKMSNYQKGNWSVIWDGLFWRWIIKHQKELAGNPRWAMMVRNAQKMETTRRQAHLRAAEEFLAQL